MGKKQKMLLCIAIILGLITSGMVYGYLRKAAKPQVARPGVDVVVAKVDIAPKMVITPDMVAVAKVPAEFIQPGAIRSLQEVVGITAREQVVAGEQVTSRRLLLEKKAVGLSGIIPDGKRAVTVGVNDIVGVAGFVKPGDAVDVLVTFDNNVAGSNVTSLVLQDVIVLAVNTEMDDSTDKNKDKDKDKEKEKSSKTGKNSTVTLAVSPQDAEKLVLAEDKGKLRLALRPYFPAGYVATSGIVPQDITGRPLPQAQANHQSAPAPKAPETVSKQEPKPQEPPGKTIQVIRGSTVVKTAVNE